MTDNTYYSELADAIDVWHCPGCVTEYSISVCDADGEEIECVGGDDDPDTAFATASELADRLGVPARLLSRGTELVEREYDPAK